tara:strand:+ start:583 stop:1089 length:507 start_codon:yes stop_codon:yes gene_type:complete
MLLQHGLDNFLSEEEFKRLIDIYPKLPLNFNGYVADSNDPLNEEWNWYATHTLYKDGKKCSEYSQEVYDIFFPHFEEIGIDGNLSRMKLNCYPRTEVMREHKSHIDYDKSHQAAIFSLNTCDGFTRLPDGSKGDSISNRIIFFNASQYHNSSTTTNSYARYNINFNFL